eukprot:EG_transcript_19965
MGPGLPHPLARVLLCAALTLCGCAGARPPAPAYGHVLFEPGLTPDEVVLLPAGRLSSERAEERPLRTAVLALAAGAAPDFRPYAPFLLSALRVLPGDAEVVLFTNAGIAHPLVQWVQCLRRGLPPPGPAATIRVMVISKLPQKWAAFPLASQRYAVYLQYLRSERGRRYEKVLLTDSRDVLFQGDPFLTLTGNATLLFAEDKRFSQSTLNRHWLSGCYPHDKVLRIVKEFIVCSGVTMGPRQPILAYLQAMAAELLRLRARVRCQSIGMDQPVHNWVAYATPSSFPKIILQNGRRGNPVYHMALSARQAPR